MKRAGIRKIGVVSHYPEWAARFRAEALRLRALLGDNAVAFHHIGSTAIPDIKAKPIIDLLVEVRDITRVDDSNPKMIRHGYLKYDGYRFTRPRKGSGSLFYVCTTK